MLLTEKIQTLMTEAGEHGDLGQVEICRRALGGDKQAVLECERVISHAAAARVNRTAKMYFITYERDAS